jgi:hypothetical protein
MYDIVYNAYSNTLFLLGNKFLEKLKFEEYNFKLDNFRIRIYKNSGFLVYENKNIKYCFNFKGHQNSLKHRFDSRVSPFSLLCYKEDDKNLLPAVGYSPQSILRLVETKFPLRILYGRLYKYFYFDWLPLFGGNGFYYIRNDIKFYPFKCIKMLKLKDKIICKFKSQSRSLFSKKVIDDDFVISIDLKDTIEYKILFYEKVDKFYYTYKEMEHKVNFDYVFNHKYKKIKPISIETSHEMADLYRFEFNKLQQIKIKVEV